MKLAIAGKGGVGKTTLASLLAKLYSLEGRQVIAIDADPDANLAGALGISAEQARNLKPISELEELIEERTGAKPGEASPFFKLNPRVDDIPERFSVKLDNIRLLIMGRVRRGGSGCLCSESAVLRSLTSHLLLSRSEVVIMDMEAGLEHLGRGTARGMDAFIVVVEPGQRSLETAAAVCKLARDLGVDECYAVGFKTRGEADHVFIRQALPGFHILGFVDFDPQIADADRRGASVFDNAPQAVAAVREIKAELERKHTSRAKA